MAKELHVDLVAVEQKVWSGEATMLIARTTEGELGVLPRHTPLLGQLVDPGTVKIERDGEPDLEYTVHGGFLSVTESGVTVLAERCEPIESGSAQAAEAH